MKKIKKNIFGIGLALAMIMGVVFSFVPQIVNAEQGGGGTGTGDCCRNGYKMWDDPGIFGNHNFKDCWCIDHKGRNPVSCSCEPAQ